MRAFLIALMIAILPLRGWMGDAMAIGMAGEQHDTAGAPMAHAMAAAHEDCAGMSAASMAPAVADGSEAANHSSASGDCDSCSVCQVCNTVALAVDPLSAVAPASPHASPAGVLTRFASFYPQRGHKPPIS
jgi:hypothetical protein